MYTTLFTCPHKEKSRGVRTGDLAGHATGPHSSYPFLPVDSVQMSSYLQAEVRWIAIMLEPHFSSYRKGYLLHEQWKRLLEEFQLICPIQTVWNDNRSQYIISKNSTPDVYIEPRLVNSDEHYVRILTVPDVAVSAVKVAISCEASLISKQDLSRKGRIHDAPLQKPLDKSNTRCKVVGPQFLYFLEVVCMEFLFLQDSPALKTDLNPWHGQ